jgi:hypothetical protein
MAVAAPKIRRAEISNFCAVKASIVWTSTAVNTSAPPPPHSATTQLFLTTRAQAVLGMVSCWHGDTSTPRSSCHPLCDAGRHGPTHRTGLRPAGPIRALASSRPWHPTTNQPAQDSNVLAAYHSAMSCEILAGSYRTSRARQIKFTRGILLLFSFDLSVRFRLRVYNDAGTSHISARRVDWSDGRCHRTGEKQA